MPYAVECLFEVYEVDEGLLVVFFIYAFFTRVSHCEEFIYCASSWPGPGLFFPNALSA